MRNLFAFAVLGTIAACCDVGSGGSATAAASTATGGATGTGGSTGTAGGTTTGGTSCSGNGDACSALANAASATNLVDVPSVPPMPGGGGVSPGTYYLTSASMFTGEGGAKGKTTETLQATLQLSGSGTMLNEVVAVDGCPATTMGSLSFGATQLTLDTSCPANQHGTIGYSSGSTALTLFVSALGPDSSEVFEMQVYTLQQP